MGRTFVTGRGRLLFCAVVLHGVALSNIASLCWAGDRPSLAADTLAETGDLGTARRPQGPVLVYRRPDIEPILTEVVRALREDGVKAASGIFRHANLAKVVFEALRRAAWQGVVETEVGEFDLYPTLGEAALLAERNPHPPLKVGRVFMVEHSRRALVLPARQIERIRVARPERWAESVCGGQTQERSVSYQISVPVGRRPTGEHCLVTLTGGHGSSEAVFPATRVERWSACPIRSTRAQLLEQRVLPYPVQPSVGALPAASRVGRAHPSGRPPFYGD